jgi:hypothetical protein
VAAGIPVGLEGALGRSHKRPEGLSWRWRIFALRHPSATSSEHTTKCSSNRASPTKTLTEIRAQNATHRSSLQDHEEALHKLRLQHSQVLAANQEATAAFDREAARLDEEILIRKSDEEKAKKELQQLEKVTLVFARAALVFPFRGSSSFLLWVVRCLIIWVGFIGNLLALAMQRLNQVPFGNQDMASQMLSISRLEREQRHLRQELRDI